MSTSRLEKFIYAICSMEVSDLPAPLSRIEILWNCLITGETPDFEPQSRNEQYLMAMLDRYNISNLPAPMSRGEKLLYKIAVGETDLSDVPGYLSRYEELLKYLIENGGISGGDFEYVLYTLNQSLSTLYTTAEKPVKSAILKGQTLVNLSEINKFSISGRGTKISTSLKMMKNNTFYTRIVYITKNTLIGVNIDNNVAQTVDLSDGNAIFSTDRQIALNETGLVYKECLNSGDLSSKLSTSHIRIFNDNTGGVLEGYEIIVEGDHTQEDIPYFEGMQSVKLPVLTTVGKNLFDVNKYPFQEGMTYNYETGDKINGRNNMTTADMIPIKGGEKYSFNAFVEDLSVVGEASVFYFDKDKKYISRNVIARNDKLTITPPTNASFVSFTLCSNNATFLNGDKFMLIESGTIPIEYEPYKTNILSTPSDLELRGIGNVQDTLDLVTGEVTERIGEIVLDGSENWRLSTQSDDYADFRIMLDESLKSYTGAGGLCDKLKYQSNKYGSWIITDEGITVFINHVILSILKTRLQSADVSGFKTWLSQNPITVQYELAIESIKTVDLTTVDQDGQPTKLKTFNDITYVEIKADNLIPSVDLEVATKINETLSTLGLEHHDISETQNELGQTIEEQTENTDATMMATTEIYEQTL